MKEGKKGKKERHRQTHREKGEGGMWLRICIWLLQVDNIFILLVKVYDGKNLEMEYFLELLWISPGTPLWNDKFLMVLSSIEFQDKPHQMEKGNEMKGALKLIVDNIFPL